jgi:isopenicillin-N epimerase
MPVKLICKKAHQAGIMTVIDGAHAPGQIPLDLRTIGPDFYLGNCHKWMQSAKGAGFLYARRELQPLLDPLVISWGWGQNASFTSGSQFLDYFEWTGTNDPSAYLSVPAAIQFQEQHNWPEIQQRCQQILAEGLRRIDKLTGLGTVYSELASPFVQMAVARLPLVKDLAIFKSELLEQYRIEVPCTEWNGYHFIRISIQAYNDAADLEALAFALEKLLREHRLES